MWSSAVQRGPRTALVASGLRGCSKAPAIGRFRTTKPTVKMMATINAVSIGRTQDLLALAVPGRREQHTPGFAVYACMWTSIDDLTHKHLIML